MEDFPTEQEKLRRCVPQCKKQILRQWGFTSITDTIAQRGILQSIYACSQLCKESVYWDEDFGGRKY